MRTFYIFKINSSFAHVYQERPYKLYKMLEEMYYTRNYNIQKTLELYEQLSGSFHKHAFNEYISSSLYGDYNYERNNNVHLYHNGYEFSKLIIGNANIKLESNLNYPIFFKTINDYIDSVFVCDFKEKDYFWLDKIIINDGQKDNNLVKL